MMLHARRILVPISANKAPVAVEAPPPDAMAALVERLLD